MTIDFELEHFESYPIRRGDFLATVVVPLHNHARFIEERLESLFAQWIDGFELLLVDDASVDNGFEIAERVVARHATVPATTVRNATRLGMGVLNVVLRLTRSDIIIQADSDDVALPGRLQAIWDRFGDRDCRLVTSNAVILSAEGFAAGLIDATSNDEIFSDPRTAATCEFDRRWLGATAAYHRSLLEHFPPIDPETCPYGLDLLLPFRALLLGSHHYISQPLVGWRDHGRNTHHVAGATSLATADAERYQAFELMVLRQKLADAEHCRRNPGPKPFDDGIIDLCRNQFLGKFEQWSRSRAIVASAQNAFETAAAASTFVKRPPVTTLLPGRRIVFGEPFGAAILDGWPGFHQGEDWGVWTMRHAIFCVNIASPSITALRLTVNGRPFAQRQRVRFSVGLTHWAEIELLGGEVRVVELAVKSTGHTLIFVSAQDATVPGMGDCRLLGVGLQWLEAAAVADTPSTADV